MGVDVLNRLGLDVGIPLKRAVIVSAEGAEATRVVKKFTDLRRCTGLTDGPH